MIAVSRLDLSWSEQATPDRGGQPRSCQRRPVVACARNWEEHSSFVKVVSPDSHRHPPLWIGGLPSLSESSGRDLRYWLSKGDVHVSDMLLLCLRRKVLDARSNSCVLRRHPCRAPLSNALLPHRFSFDTCFAFLFVALGRFLRHMAPAAKCTADDLVVYPEVGEEQRTGERSSSALPCGSSSVRSSNPLGSGLATLSQCRESQS